MATTLALAMRASMSASGVVSGAGDASRALDRMGKQAKQTASDVSMLKNIAIGAVLAKGIGIATNAFMSASRAAVSYAASVTQGVDAMNDLAERTGIGVESLQALQMAAKLSGVDDVTSAVQKLSVTIGKASESGNTEAFTKLGIQFSRLQQLSPERQFMEVQKAISGLPLPAQRAAAAVELFGKSGVELLPLMNKNINEMEGRMKRLGIIVGTDQVKAIADMNDALDEAKATFAGITAQVISSLSPIVKSLVNDMLKFVESFKSVNGSGGQGIANTIADGLLRFADVLAKVFDYAVDSFKGIADRFELIYKVADKAASLIPFARAVRAMTEGGGGGSESSGGGFASGLVADARKSFFNRLPSQSAPASGDRRPSQSAPASGDGGTPFYKVNDNAARAAMQQTQRQSADAKAAGIAAFKAAAMELSSQNAAYRTKKQQADAQEQADRQKQKAEQVAGVQKDIEAKKQEGRDILSERKAALGGKSNEALKANDVRSGEGMAQFLALASGREDPAIAEYRKQTQKLDEIRGELKALQTEKVTILNGAGA